MYLKVALLLVFLSVAATQLILESKGPGPFYSNPSFRFFYGYRPYRQRRSASDESKYLFYRDSSNITTCSYSTKSSYLSCFGPQRSINCSTTLNLSGLGNLTFDAFTVGLFRSDMLFSTVSLIKYDLYPFKISKINGSNVYMDYALPFYGKHNAFRLFYSGLNNSTEENGIRVEDFDCFYDLVTLLNESDSYLKLQETIQEAIEFDAAFRNYTSEYLAHIFLDL